MTKPLWRRAIAFALGLAMMVAVLQTLPVSVASAMSGSDFDPGYLVSDQRFFDKDSMSEQQIQNFLDYKVGQCRSGYTCINRYTESTFSRAAVESGHCAAYAGAANEPASRIIFKVAQACRISPQTILVLLEKETSLVTSDSPSASRYQKAAGYGCPDTSNCDSAFYGFYNQVYKAAWQFRQYTNYPDRYFHIGNVSVGFHPNSACGSSVVSIKNQATANLYNYTPYQPNAAALGNLYGTGDGCSSYGNRNFWRIFSDWFGPTVVPALSPVGNLEVATASVNSASFRGWTFDPETPGPINVHLYINDQWGGSFEASVPRLDIANAYPSYGSMHGFDFTVPIAPGSGTFRACLYAINVAAGGNVLLGCRALSTPTGSPFGTVDSALLKSNQVQLSGWMIDPDGTASIATHVYVNGRWAGAFVADAARADVAQVYPGYGSAHGFAMNVGVPVGTSDVCVFGINVGGGDNALVGCKTVSTASGPPIGNVESAPVTPGHVTVGGWALDPDSPDPIDVHVYVNGKWGGAVTANVDRADVALAYSGYGTAHGFTAELPVPAGTNSICVYGINVRTGYNSLIRCTTVVSPGGPPFGNFESVAPSGTGSVVQGWAIDPDTASPVDVHVYVNGQWAGGYHASAERADVGRMYASYGSAHGFSIPLALGTGPNEVCIFAINLGTGFNQLLGCKAAVGG